MRWPLVVALTAWLGLGCRASAPMSAGASSAPRSTPTAPPPSTRSPEQWADSVLATLPLRDRVAQLVWPWVLGDYQAADAPALTRVLASIREQHVGGIIMSIGSPIEVAAKLNFLQRASAVPLLVGADLEYGAAFRLRGGYATPNGIDLGSATMFPTPMGIGATRDTTLAYEMGRITAVEGRAVGLHYAFAPVADVNVNPKNPVIGARSFGENPQLVSAMVASMVRGLQDGGMAATAKHFPGHGDTEQNSHLELARVTASAERLEAVELAPFRAAIAAGARGMMTFHGRLDALDPSGTAATLSKPIMTDLLRGRMGFQGLIITDALDMNGVMGPLGMGEVCVRALDAGADVLLMPTSIPQCIDALVASVERGRVSAARIEVSARRILVEKARFGLDTRRTVDVEAVRQVVADSAHLASAARAAAKAITLAKDEFRQVPVVATLPRTTKVLAVTITPRTDLGAGLTFDAALRRRFPALRSELMLPEVAQDNTVAQPGANGTAHYVPSTAGKPDEVPGNLAALLRAADSAEVVIVSSYVIQTSVTATSAAPRGVTDLLRALLSRGKKPIVVSFGNPYLLAEVPELPAYLVAWGAWGASQLAAARAITGEAPISGLTPATLGPGVPFGTGQQRPDVRP